MYKRFSATLRSPFALAQGILLAAFLAAPLASHAQVGVYVEGTASDLQGGPGGNYLYGGTVGLLADGPRFWKIAHLSADIQGRYVTNAGERLVGVAVGPRLSLSIHKLGLAPYGGFMVGFARYRDSAAPGALNTTDNQWQANMGVVRRLNPRLDASVDYDYSEYGTENGKYNPKHFSAGIIFHIVKQ
jgi:hypothetical protein